MCTPLAGKCLCTLVHIQTQRLLVLIDNNNGKRLNAESKQLYYTKVRTIVRKNRTVTLELGTFGLI